MATSKVDLTVPVTSEAPCFCAALQASFRPSRGVSLTSREYLLS